jgi:methionyl aminopeptidase
LIVLKSQEEINKIADASRIAAEALDKIKGIMKPGITTGELDSFAASFIISKGAVPAFKGYKGYPANLCASVNEEVVHGIPSTKKKLKEGDIISIDLGVYFKGFYGDIAATFPVGKVSKEAEELIKTTRKALYIGIEKAVVNNRLGDISFAIQDFVESKGFSVVRNFVGHGIGRELHEEPQIPNFGKAGKGPVLMEGMVLAIEPMVNAGTWDVIVKDDGWTATTKDNRLSAHFEHTVAITTNGPVILTKL